MADLNYDPNARYDIGPNAAGCGRCSNQNVLDSATQTGLASDGTMGGADLRVGFNVIGGSRKNVGGNVQGAQRSINGT